MRAVLCTVVALAIVVSALIGIDQLGVTSPPADHRRDARRADGSGAEEPAFAGRGGRAAASSTARDGLNASEAAHEPGELLVAVSADSLPGAVADAGFRVLEISALRSIGFRLFRLRVPTGSTVAAARVGLRRLLPGADVDANHHFIVAAGFELPPSHARALIGWDRMPIACGSGLRLAMVDTPVDTHHPALAGSAIEYREFATPGRRPAAADHGTAIAALMVGTPTPGKGWGGLVPSASLLAAGIFEANDAGEPVASARGLLAAVDWIAGERPNVLNLSIAGPDNRVVRAAVQRLQRDSLVIVAAAGNWGAEGRAAYPAAYPEVIAVTAVGRDRRIFDQASRGDYVQFAAPGVGIWTAVPDGGRFQSGTSFASPYVSVMAALAMAAGTPHNLDQLRQRLRRDAVDLGPPGRDETFGWGLVTMRPPCGGAPAAGRQSPSGPRLSARTN